MSADPLTAVTNVQTVARLIGSPAQGGINNTVANWDVQGADLGSMFDLQGKLYMVFGDTFGPPPPANGGPGGSDWRSNTMAVISNWQNPQQGLYFDSMISDEPGHAQALIQGLHDLSGKTEVTKIPTGGIASVIGPKSYRMYLDVMSVKQWGSAGHRTILNDSAIYYSDDLGQTWQESNVIWHGNSNFAQVAIVRVGDETNPAGSMLYFYGIPVGGHGSVQLARVPELEILEPHAYQYWGMVNGKLGWTSQESAAVDIVKGPVDELSVMWDPYLNLWLMTYLNVGVDHGQDPTLQLRDSPQLWGSWSQPHKITDSKVYPELYGAYMHPWLTQNNGKDIYFTMSMYGPYAVYLMHATLFVANTTAIYDPLLGTWSIKSNLPHDNITLLIGPQPGSNGPPVIQAWEGNAPGSLSQEIGDIPGARTIYVTLAEGGTLTVDDSADTTGRTVTIGGASIRGLKLFGQGGIHYNGKKLASLTVHGGQGGVTMQVSGTSTQTELIGDPSATNTLVGPNAWNTWEITGSDTGAILNDLAVSFSGFGNLTGGPRQDQFLFQQGASLSGKIDGGRGANTLDYSAGWSGNVVVNLQLGLATAVAGGVTNIRNLRGAVGGAPDLYNILLGKGGDDIIGGDGRTNLLESGKSASTLQGGNQDDILIGGTTSYDQESDAHDLIVIMTYWSNTQDSYATRVNNLVNGTGVPPLNVDSASNNGGGNKLLGHRRGAKDQNLYYGLALNRETTDLDAAVGEHFIKI